MYAVDSGIWPGIVEIGKQKEELGKKEGWNMEMRAIDRGEWEKIDKKI